jgi:predicted HicB family RNase H-like nuclease
MAQAGEEQVQLATRIPARLHRAIKLHCVEQDTSVMEFVAQALKERLEKIRGRGRRGGKGRGH